MLQIYIPEETGEDLKELLHGSEVLGTWRDATMNKRVVLHILVPLEETEAIMDRFEKAFAAFPGFHLILSTVEAVLPRKAEKEANPKTNDKKTNGKPVAETGRASREELYHDVQETLGINRLFVAMCVLSAIVAAVGLLRNDVAVIIGAMVMAPLLGPNVAMSLATTLGDLKLLRKALWTNLVGVTIAVVLSIGIGWMFSVNTEIPAIAARTQLSLSDLILALAAGSAGTFAFSRSQSGSVIGVMVAVALMPPWVVFGMLMGAGHYQLASGALLLVSANLVCINLAGVATLLFEGVRPRSWWEEARAKQATRIAIFIWLLLLLALGFILYLKPIVHNVFNAD